jgi:hypothetical protein
MKVSSLLYAAVAITLAAGLLLSPTSVLAQTDTGSVDGRVFDETKAAVPGATITARNQATGLTRSVTSSASGTYRIALLPAGSYEVTADLTGFAKQVRRDVTVQIGTTPTIDFTMTVSAQTETIEVIGQGNLIQTTTSDVGQVITEKMVQNIPLNGRKFQDLSLLVPGTRQSNYYDPTKTEVGGVSYGGGQGRSVIINVDGADNNDGVVRGILQQYSAEAIQEYKVTTQHYSAEFGRSVGGVVNVITKSGTNDFHGSAFVFARNQSLNSKGYFEGGCEPECPAGVRDSKPDFNQQQFGGSLGGPIQKDKAHFFVSYERNRRNQFDTIFTGGALPEEDGKQIEKPFRNHLLTAKVDFQLNDKNSLVVRYALEDNIRNNDFVGGNTLESSAATNTNKIHSGVAKNTTVFGNNKVNEFVVTFQHFENNITADFPNIPNISTPDFVAGANPNTPQQTIQRRWQVRDDYSFRKENWGGDHDFKVGAELLQSHYGGFFIPTLYGFFNFAKPLGPPGTPLSVYQNAIADSFSGSAGTNVADDNWTYVAGYLQDDWKPSRKLTINLGLRYEIQTGPYANKFHSLAKDVVAAAGYPSQLSQDKNNFGPRVGFAYDVTGEAKYVVRGGYGLYYDEIYQNITLYEAWSDPATPLNFVSASPAPFTPNQFAANRDAIRNSFIDPTFSGQILRLTAPDLVQPYSHHANIGFSFAPWRAVAFDLDGVGSWGKQEVARWEIDTKENQNTRLSPAGKFDPNYNRITVEGNRGHSSFYGVYFTAKVRHSKLNGLATYTWSKAKNVAEDFFGRPSDISNLNWEGDYGPTPNDVRHRVTAGLVYQLPAHFQLSSGFQWNTPKPYSANAGLAGRRNAVRAIDPTTGEMFPRNSFFTGVDPATGAPRDLNYLSLDARLSKMFRFGKSSSFELLFEVFNLTNHVNFSSDANQGFINTYTSPNFGKPTQIVPNSQRQAEFGARFSF